MLSGSEYVNSYIIPRLFDKPPSGEQLQLMIQAWDIILKHIEEKLAFATAAYTVTTLPLLPTAAATPMKVSVTSGSGLNNTGGELAQKFVNQMLAGKDYPPETLQNLTDNFNRLFAHITEKAEVTISNIKHNGTVNSSTPFAWGGTSSTPVKGQGI